MVDALDECDSEKDIRLILQLLAEAKTLETVRLKFFVTSRPARFGLYGILMVERQDCILHNISEPVIQHDISLFLRHELGIIRRKKDVTDNWPGEQTIDLLCQKSEGLFIHTSTACRFIGDPDWDPNESLSLLLKDDYVGQSPTRNLDHIYTQILTHSIIPRDCNMRERKNLSGEFGQIVGSIVTLLDSLSAAALAGLLAIPVETICLRLRSLHSILEAPESQELPIRLLHQSFRDFLLDQQRCLDPQFWINEKKTHEALAQNCLLLMSNNLRRDMCNLKLPGALATEAKKSRVEKNIPLHVQYACRYWVDHVKQSNIDLYDNSDVHMFLQNHFLHWLEALSLMGNMSFTIVRSLESIHIVSPHLLSRYNITHSVNSNLVK